MRKANLIAAVIGAALLAWVIMHSGRLVIIQQLTALRIALPIVVALSLGRLLMQTLSWSASLKNEGLEVGVLRLMGIRLASQAMGYLTVFGPVVSEPMKINLLRTPVASTATATFLDNGVYWFTSALLGIAGCFCLSLLKTRGNSVLALCAVFVLVIAFMARRKSVLSSIAGALGKRSPSWLNRAGEIESSIRNLRTEKPELVSRMFWLSMGCQLLLASEVAVVLWSLRLPLHLVTVFAIEGLTRAVKMMSGWVPARLGADESGAMSAFAASGLSPAFGLTLAFTRRARDLSWALVGLAWLAWRSRVSRESKTEGETMFTEGALPCKSLS
ncbi:MAG TPA: lysylphosphatidylglycerol synthase domain-containing protein [Terriglobales bacterium]|nr:lysylphosphatidylglycerol synthase domain-containing protein [Terriglobales bacterium]